MKDVATSVSSVTMINTFLESLHLWHSQLVIEAIVIFELWMVVFHVALVAGVLVLIFVHGKCIGVQQFIEVYRGI